MTQKIRTVTDHRSLSEKRGRGVLELREKVRGRDLEELKTSGPKALEPREQS